MDELSFCLVSTFYPPHSFGGDAVHVHRLAVGLAERGHRVRVVHSPAAYRMLAGGSTPAAGHAEHPGVEVVAAPSGPLAVAGTYLTGTPAGYRRRLGALLDGFDVVHFHNPSLLGGPGALGMGSGLRVFTATEHWLLCPTHVLFRYGREVCTERTCWRCTIQHRRPPQLWRSTTLLERSVKELDLLVCPSRFTADLHRKAFPTTPIEVLPLFFGPDPDRLADPRAYDHPRPYVLYAGRLEPIKGVETLIEAFAGVRGADLLIAGDGSRAEALRAQAAGWPSIRFLGRVPHDEALALSRGALALVVPSAGYESFGGVAVEAMAFGTPVVVRALGPLPELVSDGGGFTFTTAADLTNVLQRLIDTPGDARRAGEEARRTYEARWTDASLFGGYFDLLAAAAERRGLDRIRSLAHSAAAAERTGAGR